MIKYKITQGGSSLLFKDADLPQLLAWNAWFAFPAPRRGSLIIAHGKGAKRPPPWVKATSGTPRRGLSAWNDEVIAGLPASAGYPGDGHLY